MGTNRLVVPGIFYDKSALDELTRDTTFSIILYFFGDLGGSCRTILNLHRARITWLERFAAGYSNVWRTSDCGCKFIFQQDFTPYFIAGNDVFYFHDDGLSDVSGRQWIWNHHTRLFVFKDNPIKTTHWINQLGAVIGFPFQHGTGLNVSQTGRIDGYMYNVVLYQRLGYFPTIGQRCWVVISSRISWGVRIGGGRLVPVIRQIGYVYLAPIVEIGYGFALEIDGNSMYKCLKIRV